MKLIGENGGGLLAEYPLGSVDDPLEQDVSEVAHPITIVGIWDEKLKRWVPTAHADNRPSTKEFFAR